MPAGHSTGTTMSRSGKSGRCENLFVGPSVPEFSGVEGLLFESEFGGPINEQQCLPAECEGDVVSPIVRLFPLRRPHAIVRRVVSIIVLAFDGTVIPRPP